MPITTRVVNTAVARLSDLRGKQDERIENYKQTELTDVAAHDLVIRAVDAQALPVTQVPALLSEWREPSHEAFVTAGKTAWRLFNAFTDCWKGRHLAALPRRCQAVQGLLDAAWVWQSELSPSFCCEYTVANGVWRLASPVGVAH